MACALRGRKCDALNNLRTQMKAKQSVYKTNQIETFSFFLLNMELLFLQDLYCRRYDLSRFFYVLTTNKAKTQKKIPDARNQQKCIFF